MKKLLFLISSTAFLPVAPLLAENSTVEPQTSIKPDSKLERYHSILLKRPSSTVLFQKFQSAWLSKHSEASLETYLKHKAEKGSAEDKLLFAYLKLQKGKEQEALEILTSAVKQAPKNHQLYLDRAKTYARILDYDKASVDIEKAISLSSQTSQNANFVISANKLKGRFLTRQGKTEAAVAHWNTLAKENPKDQDLIEDVIDILMEDSLAPAALKLAVTLRDNTKDPYKRALRSLRVASILLKQGERDKGLEVYLKTLEISGSNSWLEREIIAQINGVYTKEDNTNGLVEKLEKLTKTYPQRSHIKLKLAEVLVSSGQFVKAKKYYKDLIKTNPGDDSLRSAYFTMLQVSKDFISARQLIDSMIKADPSNPQLQLQRASLSHQMEDKNATLTDLGNFLKVAKPSPETSTKYASLLHKYQFKKEAIAAYKKAHEDFPQSLDLALNTAKFLLFNDKKEEAIKIWKTLAQTTSSKSDLVRLLDSLLLNNQKKIALEIVKEHYEKHKTYTSFLQVAIKVAESSKEFSLATDYSYTLLLLAKNNADIDFSVSVATRNIVKSSKVQQYINTITKKQNQSLAERFLLVNLYEQNGELKVANKLLSKLAVSDQPIALLQVARIYERRYQLDKAAASLEKLITLPNSLKAVYLRQLSGIYKRFGEMDKALLVIQKWKTLAPNNKQVWMAEVSLLEDISGPEKALETLRKGVQKFQNDPDIFAKLADLNARANQFSQAKLLYWRLYDDAEKLQDRILWASQIAQISLQDGTSSDLIDKLSSRRRNSPQAIAPIMSLAEVYRVLDKTDELRKLLLEATRLRPEDPSLLLQVATIDEKNGDIKSAMEILRKAQKFEKQGNVTRKLAKLMVEEGDYDAGLEELTKLKGKATARSAESIALSLIKQDALEEAQIYLTKQLVNFPDDWRLLLLRSVVENNLGYSKQSFTTALQLLSKNNKLTKLTQGWTARLSQNYSAIDYSKLPPEYSDFFLLSAAVNQLKSLSENTNNNYSYGYTYGGASQGGSKAQHLPNDIRTLHLMAKAQILEVLSEFSGEEKASMMKEANTSGFDRLELTTELNASANNNNNYGQVNREAASKVVEKYLKANPDSKFMVNLTLLSEIQRGKMTLAPDLLKKARQLNPKEDLSYFSKVLPFFATDGVSAEDHSKQVISLIKKDGKIDDQEIVYLFSVNRAIFSMSEQDGIGKDVLSLMNQYKKENSNEQQAQPAVARGQRQGQGSNLKRQILWSIDLVNRIQILKSGDYAKIIKMIESESLQNANYGYGYGYRGARNNQQLSFPPSELTTVNQAQLSFFNQGDSPYALSKEKLAKNLDLFTNPVLKVLVSHYTDEEKDLSTFFDAAKVAAKYKADLYLLEAAYLTSQKKDMGAILASLNLARQQTIDKQQRISLNNYIYSIASASTPEAFNKLTPELQEVVRSTARRLMIQKKITEPKLIKKALALFSMEKETARFLTKQNKSIRQAKVTGRIIGNNVGSKQSSGPKDLEERVREAIKKQRVNYAVNLLLTKFKSLQRGRHHSNYEYRQWKKIVSKNSLGMQLMSKLEPKGSTSPKRWLSYYKAADLLDDKKSRLKAIEFFSQIPRVPNNVKAPLALAIYKEKPKEALELLKSSRNAHQQLSEFHNLLSTNDKNPEVYTKALTFMADYFSSIDVDSKRTVQIEGYLDNILREGIEIVNLKRKNSYNSYTQTKNGKLRKQQKDSFFRLLKVALHYEKTADAAFIMIQNGDPKKKSRPAPYIEMAKNSLLETSKPKISQRNYYSYSNGNELTSLLSEKVLANNLDRFQFLSQEIIRTKNLDVLDEGFLKSIAKHSPKTLAKLKFLKENLLTAEDTLVKNITKLGKSNDFAQFVSWSQFLEQRPSAKVQTLYAEQLLKFISRTPTVSMSREEISEFLSSQEDEFRNQLQSILPELVKLGKQKELLAVLDKLAQKEFEGVKKKAEKWQQLSYSTNHSPKGYRQKMLYNLMNVLTSNVSTFRSSLPMAEKYQFDTSGDRYSNGSHRFPNATNLYAQFKQAGYLTTAEKVTLLKLPVVKKAKSNNSFRTRSNEEKVPKYDLSYLAQKYHDLQYYNNNQSEYKKFVKLLKAAPAEEKYGAQLVLVLVDELKASLFLKNHAKEFAKVPKDQRMHLQEMLSIQENPNLVALIEEQKLSSLFPIDREKINEKLKKEADVILKVKVIQSQNEFDTLERNLIEFLKKSLKVNLELSADTFSHYINLLDKHRAINTQRFDLGSLSGSPFQEAIQKKVLEKLYIKDDNQHEALRLIYRLTKHPLSHKFSLKEMIIMTIPNRWLKNVAGIPHYWKALDHIVLKTARRYNALTDPDEKTFLRGAWCIYMNTNTWKRCIFWYVQYRLKKFYVLRKKNPECHEFIMFLSLIANFQDVSLYNVIGANSFSVGDYTKKITLILNYRTSIISKYFKEIGTYQPQVRAAVLSCLIYQFKAKDLVSQFPLFADLYLDEFSEILKERPDLVCSNDTRFMCHPYTNQILSAAQVVKIRSLGSLIVNKQIEHLENGDFIHRNHFINASAQLAIDKTGADELREIFKENSSYFIGESDMAQIFLRYGYLEEIKQILDNPSAIKRPHNLPGATQRPNTVRTTADDNTEKYIPEVLKLYKTNTEKAQVAGLLYLPNRGDFSKAPLISSQERIALLTDLTLKAYKETKNLVALKEPLDQIFKFADVPTIKKMAPIFEAMESKSPDLLKQLYNENVSELRKFGVAREKYTAYLKHLILTGQHEKYMECFQLIKPLYPTGAKRRIFRYKAKVINNSFAAVYALMLEYYADPNRDEELRKLLPLIRKVNAITDSRKIQQYYSWSYTSIFEPCISAKRLSKFIHIELGEKEAWDTWVKSLPKKEVKLATGQSRYYPVLAFPRDIYILGDARLNKLTYGYMPLLQRLINTKSYQKHIIDEGNGNVRMLVEFGLLFHQQAKILLEKLEVKYHYPEFEAVMLKDSNYVENYLGNKKKIVENCMRIKEILLANRGAKSTNVALIDMMTVLFRYQEYEKAGDLISEDVKASFNKKEKKQYDAIYRHLARKLKIKPVEKKKKAEAEKKKAKEKK